MIHYYYTYQFLNYDGTQGVGAAVIDFPGKFLIGHAGEELRKKNNFKNIIVQSWKPITSSQAQEYDDTLRRLQKGKPR